MALLIDSLSWPSSTYVIDVYVRTVLCSATHAFLFMMGMITTSSTQPLRVLVRYSNIKYAVSVWAVQEGNIVFFSLVPS